MTTPFSSTYWSVVLSWAQDGVAGATDRDSRPAIISIFMGSLRKFTPRQTHNALDSWRSQYQSDITSIFHGGPRGPTPTPQEDHRTQRRDHERRLPARAGARRLCRR